MSATIVSRDVPPDDSYLVNSNHSFLFIQLFPFDLERCAEIDTLRFCSSVLRDRNEYPLSQTGSIVCFQGHHVEVG
uniref:Uncharacterized protein n=1 Tax=Arion vulgaris TaxID=1028688 RepID=A0A0B7BQ36_9EUPU